MWVCRNLFQKNTGIQDANYNRQFMEIRKLTDTRKTYKTRRNQNAKRSPWYGGDKRSGRRY